VGAASDKEIDLEPDEYREAGLPPPAPAEDHYGKIMFALIIAIIGAWIRYHL
jgi:hypothetical protein